MKKLVIFSVFYGFLAIFWGGFFASQAYAIPGDVNGSGVVEVGDVTYLIAYLYQDGPAPINPIDADVDGSPGINTGDLMQLIGHIYGPCNLQPYTGATIKEYNTDILFYAGSIRPMAYGNPQTIDISIIRNNGPDLMGMVIPISYANQPNQVNVTLDNVNFAGGIIPPEWIAAARIDNPNRRVLLYILADSHTDPPIATGTTGLVASLTFTLLVDGFSFTPSVTEFPPSHSFMLIRSFCADAQNPPSDRIFSTVTHLVERGDVNCSGQVELGDIVYLINYLYMLGRSPSGL